MSKNTIKEIADRRVRNEIIDYFELVSNKLALLDYGSKNPISNPYAEVFDQWDDRIHIDTDEMKQTFSVPLYTAAELEALRNYDQIWHQVLRETPDTMKIEAFVETASWKKMARAAKEALAVFQERGKLFDEE